jgi:hypothetical protein
MSIIVLQPAAIDVIQSLGVTSGRWNANGVDNPSGAVAWLKYVTPAPDITWQMADTTAGVWLTNSNTFTAAQWDAYSATADADGFKPIELTVIPTWTAPSFGNAIDFQVGASSGWQMKTGTTVSGHYALVAAVPEPDAIVLLIGILFVACQRLPKRLSW